MNQLFIRWIIAWMRYDIALEKKRLQHVKECLAQDEARLHYWQMKLMTWAES